MFCGMSFVCYLMSGIKRKAEETEIAKLRTGGVVDEEPLPESIIQDDEEQV